MRISENLLSSLDELSAMYGINRNALIIIAIRILVSDFP
ncbi:TPA: hypothetical protein QIM62_004777 [Klebsiella aerogenes]|nr:hypothetical protein [Klebsiella aerogenes]